MPTCKNINNHLFDLCVIKKYSFDLCVFGFAKTDSLLFRTNDIITINADLVKLLLKSKSEFSIPAINTEYLPLLLINLKNIPTIMDIKLNFQPKQKEKLYTTIDIENQMILKDQLRLTNVFDINNDIKMNFSPLIGKFTVLGEMDANTLGHYDNMDLGTIEFTAQS